MAPLVDPSSTNLRRAGVALVGVVVGLVLLLIGINVLSGANDEIPPPGNPMVQTGTRPTATASTVDVSRSSTGTSTSSSLAPP